MFPIFLVMFFGLLELGNYINQITMLEKSLRAGAMYAARATSSADVTTSPVKEELANMVVKGRPTDTGNDILGGWSTCGSTPYTSCLNVTVNPRTGSENGTSVTVDVIKLFATVPYDPVLPGGPGFFGFSSLTMKVNHEQAWIGS